MLWCSFFKNLELLGKNETREDVLFRSRGSRVLTVTPQPRQTTIITPSHKIKMAKKETNSNFIAVLMKCAICEKTQ